MPRSDTQAAREFGPAHSFRRAIPDQIANGEDARPDNGLNAAGEPPTRSIESSDEAETVQDSHVAPKSVFQIAAASDGINEMHPEHLRERLSSVWSHASDEDAAEEETAQAPSVRELCLRFESETRRDIRRTKTSSTDSTLVTRRRSSISIDWSDIFSGSREEQFEHEDSPVLKVAKLTRCATLL